jgi:tetratricopeptide (TPR) repeat protein
LYVDLEELALAEDAFEEALATAVATGDEGSEARALSGLGNVSYLGDRFAAAYEFYSRSADIHREIREDDDYIASLGAATEAWALHSQDDVQEHFQFLIDEAQKRDQEELASETFARIGRRYLEAGNPDEAVDIFAISVIAGAVSTRSAEEPEAFLEGFLKAVALVTTHLLLSPFEAVRELTTSIEAKLAETYQLPADVLGEAFHTSFETMGEIVGYQG